MYCKKHIQILFLRHTRINHSLQPYLRGMSDLTPGSMPDIIKL